MILSKKLTDFFEANKDKPKNEVIELMMKEFGYKRTTAISRYSDLNNSNSIGINLKKKAFEFFDNNPWTLDEFDNKLHSKELGMSTTTYAIYKSQYKVEQQKENKRVVKAKREKEPPKYGEKYYKGRLRQKFIIDDSKLFG